MRTVVVTGADRGINNAMADPRDDGSADERWGAMLESRLSAYWAGAVEAVALLERPGHGA